MNVGVIQLDKRRMRISASTLFWTVALFAAFLGGLILPSPIERPNLEPVLIADRDVPAFQRITKSDIRTEFRLAKSIPPDAARSYDVVAGWRVSDPIQKNTFIHLDNFAEGIPSISPPAGFSVVNIQPDKKRDLLLLQMLQQGDKVSVIFSSPGSADIQMIKFARVFNVGVDRGIVGLLVDEDGKKKIADNYPHDGNYKLEPPRNAG